MKEGFKLQQVAEFSSLFDEAPKEPIEYFAGISKSQLLKVMPFLLKASSRKSPLQNIKDLFQLFFCKENSEFATSLLKKIYTISRKPDTEIRLFPIESCLQLFEFCFDKLAENSTITNKEAERNIFKALVRQNEINTTRQNLSHQSTKDLNSDIRLAALVLSQSFAYSEFENYDSYKIFGCQIIKSILFFEFLDQNVRTSTLLEKLLLEFNVENWKELLKLLLPIGFYILNNNTIYQTRIELDTNNTKQNDLFEKLQINDFQNIADIDYIKLRGNPLHKIENHLYGVIFELFALEFIHKGIYFKVSEINNRTNIYSNFRSFYCSEFSEKHLTYSILNRIFKNKYVEYNGQQMKDHGISAEPDYYVRNGNKVFLFESKDILFNRVLKHSYDFSIYEAEFRKKLYVENKNGKQKKRAVLQLINNIERILTMELSIDKNYKAKSVKIYPILILHDDMFNTVGLNNLVNYWFQAELKELSKNKGLSIKNVRQLVIIDIDSFIFYQDYFQQKKIILEQAIDAYVDYIHFNSKRNYADQEQHDKFFKRQIIPFSTFISNQYKPEGFPNLMLEKSYSLFDE